MALPDTLAPAQTNQQDVDATMASLPSSTPTPTPPAPQPKWMSDPVVEPSKETSAAPAPPAPKWQGDPVQPRWMRDPVASSDDAAGTALTLKPKDVNTFLGVPYRFGGTDCKEGVDCSAFTQMLFARNGVQGLPRTAEAQWEDTKVPAQRITSIQGLQPGQGLVPGQQLFFQGKRLGPGQASHTAYFAGWDTQPDGTKVPMMYAASSAAGAVVKQRLDTFLQHSGQSFLGAKMYQDFQHSPQTQASAHVTTPPAPPVPVPSTQPGQQPNGAALGSALGQIAGPLAREVSDTAHAEEAQAKAQQAARDAAKAAVNFQAIHDYRQKFLQPGDKSDPAAIAEKLSLLPDNQRLNTPVQIPTRPTYTSVGTGGVAPVPQTRTVSLQDIKSDAAKQAILLRAHELDMERKGQPQMYGPLTNQPDQNAVLQVLDKAGAFVNAAAAPVKLGLYEAGKAVKAHLPGPSYQAPEDVAEQQRLNAMPIRQRMAALAQQPVMALGQPAYQRMLEQRAANEGPVSQGLLHIGEAGSEILANPVTYALGGTGALAQGAAARGLPLLANALRTGEIAANTGFTVQQLAHVVQSFPEAAKDPIGFLFDAGMATLGGMGLMHAIKNAISSGVPTTNGLPETTEYAGRTMTLQKDANGQPIFRDNKPLYRVSNPRLPEEIQNAAVQAGQESGAGSQVVQPRGAGETGGVGSTRQGASGEEAGRIAQQPAAARQAGVQPEAQTQKPPIIIASNLDRATDTAEAVAKKTGGSVQTTPALQPMHLGEAEGTMTSAKLAPIMEDYFRNRPNDPLPGTSKEGVPGESPNQYVGRSLPFLQQIMQRVGNGTVDIGRHGTTRLNNANANVEVTRGATNVPLDAQGVKDANRVADQMAKNPPDVYLSAHYRTGQLAQAAMDAGWVPVDPRNPVGSIDVGTFLSHNKTNEPGTVLRVHVQDGRPVRWERFGKDGEVVESGSVPPSQPPRPLAPKQVNDIAAVTAGGDIRNAADLSAALQEHFKYAKPVADATASIADAHANVWARVTGRPVEEWYGRVGVRSGEGQPVNAPAGEPVQTKSAEGANSGTAHTGVVVGRKPNGPVNGPSVQPTASAPEWASGSNAYRPETAVHAGEWLSTAARNNKVPASYQLNVTKYGPDSIAVGPSDRSVGLVLSEALGRPVEPYREGWLLSDREAQWLGFDPDAKSIIDRNRAIGDLVKSTKKSGTTPSAATAQPTAPTVEGASRAAEGPSPAKSAEPIAQPLHINPSESAAVKRGTGKKATNVAQSLHDNVPLLSRDEYGTIREAPGGRAGQDWLIEGQAAKDAGAKAGGVIRKGPMQRVKEDLDIAYTKYIERQIHKDMPLTGQAAEDYNRINRNFGGEPTVAPTSPATPAPQETTSPASPAASHPQLTAEQESRVLAQENEFHHWSELGFRQLWRGKDVDPFTQKQMDAAADALKSNPDYQTLRAMRDDWIRRFDEQMKSATTPEQADAAMRGGTRTAILEHWERLSPDQQNAVRAAESRATALRTTQRISEAQAARQSVPVIEPSNAEAKAVSAPTEKDATGYSKSQQDYIAKKLAEIVKNDTPLPVRLSVPKDGEFTIRNEQQAVNLHASVTGKPIEGVDLKPETKKYTGAKEPLPAHMRGGIETLPKPTLPKGTPSTEQLFQRGETNPADRIAPPHVQRWRILSPDRESEVTVTDSPEMVEAARKQGYHPVPIQEDFAASKAQQPTGPARLFQHEGAPKASIEFTGKPGDPNYKMVITALSNPDASSGIHELSHIFRRDLEEMAPHHEQFAADYQTAAEWAGAKEGKWDTAAEEKWARGFEEYMREGKAPEGAPEGLARVFSLFRDWLMGIYQRIKGSAIDTGLSDEMRGVFDRQLRFEEPASAGKPTEETTTATEGVPAREPGAEAAQTGVRPEQAAPEVRGAVEPEKPNLGIAQRVQEARAQAGKQEAYEPGKVISPEASVQRGRELLAGGTNADQHLAMMEQRGKAVSGDDMAILRAHAEELGHVTDAAEDRLKANPNDIRAKKAYDDAWQAENTWLRRIRPYATEWSQVGRAMQGETEIDSGIFHGSRSGMRRSFEAVQNRDMTPQEETRANAMADHIKSLNDTIAEQARQLDELKTAQEANRQRMAESRQRSVRQPTEGPKRPVSIPTDREGLANYFAKRAQAQERMPSRQSGAINLPGGFTPAENAAIWKYAKSNYIDVYDVATRKPMMGKDFGEVIELVARDLGLKPEEVIGAFGGSKRANEITTAMFKSMHDRRMAMQMAKGWVESAGTPEYQKFLKDAWSFPRALAVFGHGTVGMVTHAGENLFTPSSWDTYWKNFGKQFSIFLRPDGNAIHEKMMQSIEQHPDYALKLQAGLKIDPYKVYDDYQTYSRLLGKVGGFIGKIGNKGNLGMDVLKKFRSDFFDSQWNALPKDLKTVDMAKELANMINHASGAGDIGTGQIAGVVKAATFASSLEASRWARLLGDPAKTLKTFAMWDKATPAERAIAVIRAKRYAQMASMYLGALALNQGMMNATGQKDKVNFTDPSKSDFMRFKWNGKTYDPTGNMLAPVRLLARLVQSVNKHDLRGFGGDMAEYGRGKLTPQLGVATDLAFRQDAIGRPLPIADARTKLNAAERGKPTYTWGEYAAQHGPIPFAGAFREVYQGLRENGVPHPTAAQVLTGLLNPAALATLGTEMLGVRVGEEPKQKGGVLSPLPKMPRAQDMGLPTRKSMGLSRR